MGVGLRPASAWGGLRTPSIVVVVTVASSVLARWAPVLRFRSVTSRSLAQGVPPGPLGRQRILVRPVGVPGERAVDGEHEARLFAGRPQVAGERRAERGAHGGVQRGE
jgi:hypothetical protein